MALGLADMLLALVLAAAPLISNSRVVVWEASPDMGPREHDAILVEVVVTFVADGELASITPDAGA